jgi:hypothetical protein
MAVNSSLKRTLPIASNGATDINTTSNLNPPIGTSWASASEERCNPSNEWFDSEEEAIFEFRQARRMLLCEASDQLNRGAAPASLLAELRWLEEQLGDQMPYSAYIRPRSVSVPVGGSESAEL